MMDVFIDRLKDRLHQVVDEFITEMEQELLNPRFIPELAAQFRASTVTINDYIEASKREPIEESEAMLLQCVAISLSNDNYIVRVRNKKGNGFHYEVMNVHDLFHEHLLFYLILSYL